MYVCMYACMYECMYVSMSVCMNVCMYVCVLRIHLSMFMFMLERVHLRQTAGFTICVKGILSSS